MLRLKDSLQFQQIGVLDGPHDFQLVHETVHFASIIFNICLRVDLGCKPLSIIQARDFIDGSGATLSQYPDWLVETVKTRFIDDFREMEDPEGGNVGEFD